MVAVNFQLGGAVPPLNPAIKFVHPMRVLSAGTQKLKILRAVVVVEGHPTLLDESEARLQRGGLGKK
jgi:hypothetical protein